MASTAVVDPPHDSAAWWERLVGSSHVPPEQQEIGGGWDFVWQASVKPVIMYYIPPLLASYGACTLLLRHCTDWRGLKLQKVAGSLCMYPAFMGLIWTSHATLLDRTFWGSYEARFSASSATCDAFANLYIATNLVQAIGQAQTEKPPLLYQLMMHHFLSVACYTSGFYFDRFRWWTALAGCCEITNLFLVPVFLCKEFFPAWKEQQWYLWNSRLLWMTFVTHRLMLFPAWLALWFWDRWQHWHVIHWVEGVVYPVTILGLLVLSTLWFLMISRGLKKQTVAYLDAQERKKKEKML